MSFFGLSTAEGALIVSGAAFGLSLYTPQRIEIPSVSTSPAIKMGIIYG